MDTVLREIDGQFGDGRSGFFATPGFRYSFLPGRAARAYPLLNVSEDRENVYVDALTPGLDAGSLNLNVVSGQLTLSGEKPVAGKDVRADAYHRNERSAGRFIRTITLPADVDPDKAKAEYRNGVLSIVLPKSEAAKPREIQVKAA